MGPNLKQQFKSIVAGIAMGFMMVSAAFGQATLLPNATQRYVDDNGLPVANGKVNYYIPSTTTRKTVWQDAAETTPQANPVLLDNGGKPQPAGQTYGSGCYRQQVLDQNGLVIWDAPTCSTGSSTSGGVAFSEGVMVGTIVPWANSTLPAKYLYASGQGIVRASYPDLFTALTYQFNILCSSGIQTITVPTSVSDAVPLGAPVEATCFAPGTTVSSKVTGQLTLSNPATTTTSVAITIFPWGNGDGATSFNVPDLRGRVIAGPDNMGGSITSRLTFAFYGNNPDAIGATGGSQSHVLQLSELPAGITSSGVNTITVTPTGGGLGVPTTVSPGNISGVLASTSAGTVSVPASSAASWGGTSQFTGSNTINVTSTNTGAGGHSIVQPSLTINYIIKALPDDLPTGPGVTSIQGMTGALSCGTNVVCSAQTISVTLGAHSVSNSQLAQMGAATFKSNPTASTADAQDFTIAGLTNLPTPDPVNDFMFIQDHLTGTIKKVTAGAIGTSSGVSSINGNNGAITGVDTNTLNAQTGNYPIVNTDCGKTISMSGGSFTVTLPAVAGFDPKCTINVKDASTTRGQKLSGFPSDLYNILYPLQSLTVKIVNGAWVTTVNPGRWKQANVTFNVDVAAPGNNSNDGLATGAGGAFQTLNQCRSAAQVSIDTISQGNGGVTCLVPAGQNIQEFVQVFFPLVGGGSLIFQGSGGAFNWIPANGTYALQFGDLGVVGITNVNFTTSGSTTPAGLVLGHNYGIIDFNTGVTFTANSPAVTTAMTCDFDTHFNINNGFQYVGTFSQFLFQTCQNSSWNFNNNISSIGATSIGRMFNIISGSRVIFAGNVTWGATGLSTSVGLITGNSVVNSLGGVPPGGGPTPTTGGQYCTSLC